MAARRMEGYRWRAGRNRQYIKQVYSPTGARKFDYQFMGDVYEHTFEVVVTTAEAVPEARESAVPLGRHLEGCRVGFDLGASDRKASAVVDGETVFSEEVVWDPRNQSDPEYHYRGVMDSIQRAASHMPRLDAVGGSAAGVVINNRVRVGSLYRGVPKDQFEKISSLFVRIREELGVPMEVVNDGEVTALAGSMSLKDNPVLGIALGSSTAAGYADHAGNITSWLNELAFAPIDYRADGPIEEWSGDTGCGAQFFSQQGSNRIACERRNGVSAGYAAAGASDCSAKEDGRGRSAGPAGVRNHRHRTGLCGCALRRFLRIEARADTGQGDDRTRRRNHSGTEPRSAARGISRARLPHFHGAA